MRVKPQQLLDAVRTVLEVRGVGRAVAEAQGRVLVYADRSGHPSHGVQRLPLICERIDRGLISVDPMPTTVWASPSWANVDGDAGLGAPIAEQLVDELCERAHSGVVAGGSLRNCSHLGMLAPYVERAAFADCVAIMAATSEALVHPWHGIDPVVGTNPLAIGYPAHRPVVFDMATSQVSMGKVLAYGQASRTLEPGWAVDSKGRSTPDPAAVHALSPFGGAKGWGLAVMLELLAGSLSGTSFGTAVKGTLDAEFAASKGEFVLVISMRALDAGGVRDAAKSFLDEIRGSRSALGARQQPAVPGDGAYRRREIADREGVDVDEHVWESIGRLLEGRG